MRLISRLLSVIIVLGAIAALCPGAQAGAFNYAGKRKRIYCGVAQLIHSKTDAQGNPITDWTNQAAIQALANAAATNDKFAFNGVVFAKLDALTGMKPAGWTFENPLSPTQDKTDQNYWMVPIASSRNLSRLDVIYFPGSGTISLTDEERENLRKFVDGGGVLWVDNADQNNVLKFAPSGPFFIPQVGFETNGASVFAPVSRHHPLVSTPYWLTDIDIMSLGMMASGSWTSCYYKVPTPFGNQPTSFDFLYPVVDVINSTPITSQPAVVGNTYGSGRVVATANFVGKGCLLPEPYSLPSLKLAYNIMSYACSWTDIRKGPRHTGAAIDTLGSNKLVDKWTLPVGAPGANKESAAVIYKNTVFYTQDDTLYALDANGDTNFGTWGPPDPNGGAVVIWKWSAGGSKLSAPAVATIQNPADSAPCDPIEAVMVQSAAGDVHVLPAFPLNPDGTVITPVVPLYSFPTAQSPSGTENSGGTVGAGSKWPSPPIYVNGWFYALGGQGRLYAQNPCLEKWSLMANKDIVGSPFQWQVPDPGPNSGYLTFTCVPKCGPAFGYMKGIYNGAVVGSVWWQLSPRTDPGLSHGQQNDWLWAVPIDVSNDRVRIQSIDSTRLKAEFVANFRGFLTAPDPTKPVSAVIIFRANGIDPLTITDVKLNENKDGVKIPGYITVTTSEQIPQSPRVYASYSLTYGTVASDLNQYTSNGIPPPVYGIEIEPKSLSPAVSGGSTGTYDPATMHHETRIVGSPAMGPDNMVYVAGARDTQTTADGGSVLAYQVDGSATGSAKLKWHYFLHSGLDPTNIQNFAPGATMAIPGVVSAKYKDPTDPAGLAVIVKNMHNPQPGASPAYSNGKVFVTVSGDPNGQDDPQFPTPKAALMCFKANPEFVIRLVTTGSFDDKGNPQKTPKSLHRKGDTGNYQVKIWQPNLVNTGSTASPLMDARDVTGGASVDYDTGTITFSDFSQPKVQIHGGIEANTFSPSLPVWVFLDNVEVPIDWSTWGPGATPLSNTTPATTDAVDLSGWNNLLWYYVVPDKTCTGVHSPPTVIGNTVYFTTDNGKLYALDAESGETRSQQTTQKPIWEQQINSSGTGTISPDAAVSVAGSNGVLMVPGPDGLHAYTSTTTLVADNSRLVEVDGAGDATWSVDSITWPANVPYSAGQQMAVKQGPVNKPGHARYASTGEILFANSGADQVCKIDKSGMVGFDGALGLYARWIYEKFADPRHLLSSGQPLKLRGPSDAIMWQEIEPMATTTTPSTSVVHCLIADSGNSRILDLVYRLDLKTGAFVKWDGTRLNPDRSTGADMEYIDPDSGFVLPELNWASKTDALNEKYSYNCLQLVNAVKNNKYCQDVWVASSDVTSTGTDLGGSSPKGAASLGGAIMAIGYRERTAGSPGSSNGPGTPPGNWDYSQTTSGTIVARCDHIKIGANVVPVANPRYFEVNDTANGRSLLICDNYGVYQTDISGGPVPNVVQHLWNDEYGKLRRLPNPDPNSTSTNLVPLQWDPGSSANPYALPLHASCAQRLPNHKWLVTNSFVGNNPTNNETFNGEVLEYDPDPALGANQDIVWCSPKLEWITPPSGLPTEWRQTNTTTFNLRQPKSACRQ